MQWARYTIELQKMQMFITSLSFGTCNILFQKLWHVELYFSLKKWTKGDKFSPTIFSLIV